MGKLLKPLAHTHTCWLFTLSLSLSLSFSQCINKSTPGSEKDYFLASKEKEVRSFKKIKNPSSGDLISHSKPEAQRISHLNLNHYSAPRSDCVPGQLYSEGLFAQLPVACKNKTAACEAEQIISPLRPPLVLNSGALSFMEHQAATIWICAPPPPAKIAATLNECIYLITDNKTELDEVAASSDAAFGVARLPGIWKTRLKLQQPHGGGRKVQFITDAAGRPSHKSRRWPRSETEPVISLHRLHNCLKNAQNNKKKTIQQKIAIVI